MAMSKGKILIVDDEPDICELLQFELEERGFSVKTANDVDTGLCLLSENGADVIVSDVRMPRKSGLDFLTAVNGLDIRPTFLFMSGYTDVAVQEIYKLGAAGLYAKPLDFEAMAKHIENISAKLKEDFGSRQSSRSATLLPAKIVSERNETVREAQIKNISRGGAYFHVFNGILPEVGERVQFVFQDEASDHAPIKGTGRCRWAISATSQDASKNTTPKSTSDFSSGFGIEFEEIAPESFLAFFSQLSKVVSVPAPKHTKSNKFKTN